MQPTEDDLRRDETPTLAFVYRNHRGETALRRVIPHGIRYDSTPHHPEPQWLLEAWDADRQDLRDFALKDVQSWGDEAFAHATTICELVRANFRAEAALQALARVSRVELVAPADYDDREAYRWAQDQLHGLIRIAREAMGSEGRDS